MKKILFILTLFLVPINTLAYSTAYVEEKDIVLENIPGEIYDLGKNGTAYYPERPGYYEFIDNNDNYNVVYKIKDDESNLGWVTTDLDGNKIKERVIKRYLTDFGTALYYDNYLYVLYGTTDEETDTSSSSNYATSTTIELVKYDTNGNVIKTLPIMGYETSPKVTKTSLSTDSKSYGTRIAFDAGNADMAAANGIIAANFSREMYNGHQMSFAIFVKADTLEYLNKATNFTDYGINYSHWISHSFAQRIISTEDNEFLMADQGDTYPRALVISKTSGISNPLTAGYNEFETFHFREASDSSYAYNYTYANLGNIIEVDDGYIVVGASEKTLSLNYAITYSINEPRNIFIQKLDKNFKGKTSATIQKLNTELRKSETSRTSSQNLGLLLLPGSGVVDYGVKWLTNNTSYDKSIVNVRATKLDNDNIAILWATRGLRSWAAPHDNEYYFYGDFEYYYMIIDSNGNIVQDPLEIETEKLSSLINYESKDNCIYWTQENDKGLTLYKLDTSKKDESIIFERVGNEKIYITDNSTKTYKFEVKTNKNSELEWDSSNKYVATVDSEGNVTILNSGTTTITVTNKEYNVSLDYYLDVKYKVEEVELIPATDIELVQDKSKTITYSPKPSIAYDKSFTWKSSNDNIFTIENINSTHVTIKGVSGGDAKLIGTANDESGVKVEINVHVIGKITSLSFKEDKIYLRRGETYNLKPIIEPITANEPLIYSLVSTNNSGITISSEGVITAGSTGFSTYEVRGRYSGVSTRIEVYSYDTVLDKHSIHLDDVGDSDLLKSSTYPYDENPTWESLNPEVATVTPYGYAGIVEATGKGVATIKVTAANGYSDTCTITVGDFLKGDLNFNGKIEVLDAVEALYYYIESKDATDKVISVGDFNNNKKIDVTDAVEILMLYINE